LWSVLTAGFAYRLVLTFTVMTIAAVMPAVIALGGDLTALRDWFNGTMVKPVVGLVLGLVVGLPLGLHRNLLGGLGDGGGSRNPHGAVKSRRKDRVAGIATTFAFARSLGVGGLVAGLVVGLVTGLVIWVVGRLVPKLASGFAAGLAVGSAEAESSPQEPLKGWRNDRVFGLVNGLAFGLAFGLVSGLVFGVTVGLGADRVFGSGLGLGLGSGLGLGLGRGLAGGLVYGITSSVTWSTTLAWRLQLQRSGRVPAVDLMPFLEDARDRRVLRTVGAFYQFRHASLQDHLAEQTTSSRLASSASPGAA